ncbi:MULTISPECIES: RluA family pseudouridine synthase [Mesonia]|uniref:Ribosomal large subunit pseudouridine synthase C n=1 Tax=Mesonia oceanica TaxID=2687242 RepID=A0AC61Y8F0_9FLAO|nr:MULTISPECIES: RluA family pseudouridine synthase [Mesonia]MBJ97161.1 RNA pseudouridine synthase [Flavobacteriaceae bacterium]MAN25836.1 RNA pseudouridine synthase [Mesonia sp.]MAN27646.1 RNA pseudouridine synthase [Mesonia sp.]MAQ40251.1 RNA pseudouridine synthase [Mesonia sp.]VVV00678.1 Ribosomal large subunit pseudouridine synthase C [Mesonia oceanica]
MKVVEKHIVPQIQNPIRLQEYASSIFKTITTRSGIKKAIKKQLILLNRKPANTGDWIKEGQLLELLAEELPQKKIFRLQLKIIFNDNFLAVIQKPSGYPTNGNYFKTIENALPYNLENSTEKDALPYPTPVHRLDNPTSGLLLVAKTKNVQVKLNQDFEEKNIRKSYLAIVSGEIPSTGTFNSPIEGKTAATKFQLKKTFQKNDKTYSLVELFPITGRTHQIRIHLSKNGNPIVGDEVYGSSENAKGILLAAHSLAFTHPSTKKSLHFENTFPKKFEKFIG